MLRLVCILLMIIVTIIDIGPFPITSLLMIWILLFRPRWFYNLVQRIYR